MIMIPFHTVLLSLICSSMNESCPFPITSGLHDEVDFRDGRSRHIEVSIEALPSSHGKDWIVAPLGLQSL